MSVRVKHIHWTPGGDPVVTIIAEGPHDAYRLAHHMMHGQVEFCEIGARIKRGLKRRWGKDIYNSMLRRMHGENYREVNHG